MRYWCAFDPSSALLQLLDCGWPVVRLGANRCIGKPCCWPICASTFPYNHNHDNATGPAAEFDARLGGIASKQPL